MNDNIDNLIFDFCYELAWRDATIRTAFKGSLDKNAPKVFVKNYIENIISGNKPNPCEVFSEIAKSENMINYNEKNPSQQFRFGNIQKLVNMTVKYFYIYSYGPNKKDRSKFGNCHCPIDHNILCKIDELLKQENAYEKWDKEVKKKSINHRNIHTMLNNISFSQITVPEYTLCQEIIQDLIKSDNEICNPIEFDYKYW